jgi:WD40 repeat protein
LAFSPDGRHLLTALFGKSIHKWDLKSGREVAAKNCPNYSLSLSPDGKRIAAGWYDVYLLDVDTLEIQQSLTGHGSLVYCVAFSSDGKFLASGSGDSTAK